MIRLKKTRIDELIFGEDETKIFFYKLIKVIAVEDKHMKSRHDFEGFHGVYRWCLDGLDKFFLLFLKEKASDKFLRRYLGINVIISWQEGIQLTVK